MTEMDLKIHLWYSQIKPRLNCVPSGCWEYSGRRNRAGGYGLVDYRLNGKNHGTGTHRITLEVHAGRLLGPLQACHSCDNPACCNPAHLFAGTNLDNVKDSIAKGRHHKVSGGRKPKMVNDPETVRAVMSVYRRGILGGRKTAAKLNLKYSTVRRILGLK